MEVGGDAAKRERERRLRERPHGADRCRTSQCREGGGRRDVLRPTGTDDVQRRVAPGCVEGAPQCPGAGVPSLAMPLLAGAAGQAVDDTALSYLQQSLSEKKKMEEEKKKREEEEEELRRLCKLPLNQLTPLQRKKARASLQRKKKKKKKLPRGGARLRGGVCDHAARVPGVQVPEGEGASGVPQVQFLDRVLDIPVMPHRQVRTVPKCAAYGRLRGCSAWRRLLTRPLTFQRQGCRISRDPLPSCFLWRPERGHAICAHLS